MPLFPLRELCGASLASGVAVEGHEAAYKDIKCEVVLGFRAWMLLLGNEL